MYKKRNFSAEEKVKYVEEYLKSKNSMSHFSSMLGIALESFRQWIRNYNSIGAEAFTMEGYKGYSKELKLQSVEAYLSNLYSQDEICAKYKILSKTQLQRWISMYNSHNSLKSSGAGGTAIMTKDRTTTYNERIEIVKYCIENDKNYTKTAEKFQISYQQIYSWIKKYEANGIEALLDKRGKRKLADEMSEIEKVKAKNL
ncbi:transposase [Clostridium bornimense]|uniref:helix-turn-helix domain-containing protein n=1 Tax=Clostridium bornimense TaxID=1216932 RepID=UPI001C102D7D|nr:helix-turn-helix domain-containing protein [Clostridium bornimense]MBU5317318.1 transposase [Clostridium bornimense]